MKPIRLLAFSLVSTLTVSAQTNTYPFPSSGNVGIGTTAPEAPLDVNGSIIARGLWSFIAKAPPGYWGFNHENFFAGRAGDVYSRGFSNQALGIFNGSTTAEDIFLFNQNHPNGGVLVLKASGNVGIGTANPQVRLDVQQSTNDTFIRSKSTTAGAWFIADSAAEGYFGFRMESAGAPKWFLGSYETADFSLKRGTAYDGTELIRFTTAGNVGIGTTNPTHKLAVNGTIKAKEVIVETTGWSDYVFADDYALQPLAEVEAHIKTNKHLPGIPSATEIARQGVSIGDMQAKLLAKIEELTLHVIRIEKENISLRTEVRVLRESSTR